MSLGFNFETPFQVRLSFGYLISQLEKTVATSITYEKSKVFTLLESIRFVPELKSGIKSETEIEKNGHLIEGLFSYLFPRELGETEIKAVSIPYTNTIFNLTKRFKEILEGAGSAFTLNLYDPSTHHNYIACCCLILKRYFKMNVDLSKPLFVEIPEANGISRYYRILYNIDFLEVMPTPVSKLITAEEMEMLINNYDDLDLWKRMFPVESWILKGFAIMTLIDVTVENTVSIFKEKLFALETHNFKESVASIFRSFFNLSGIEIGFTVVDGTSRRLRPAIFNHQNLSFLLPAGHESIDKRVLCELSYQRVIEEHTYFAISDLKKFYAANPQNKLARVFLSAGIGSFILIPVVKNGNLLGILEVVCHQTNVLNSINAQRLDIIMPFLADAIERLTSRYQFQVETVIQQYYTAVHPSVKWLFFREAERFIFQRELGKQAMLSEIVLKDVYPLYGQIDIKGSSGKRNESIQKDLILKLTTLLTLLKVISTEINTLKEEVPILQQMLQQLQVSFKVDSEETILGYLEKRIYPYLNKLIDTQHQPSIQAYFAEDDKQRGRFYEHRRKYEGTVSLINENLAHVLDSEQLIAQQIHPHYFEHFKTDGVEHTLYGGSSITPHSPFTPEKLAALRKWQIETLCKMSIAHQKIKCQLPYPLEVTALILAFPKPVTLRFRMDEKRFDVDGTYNVRFEIIKKRIDKALVKSTDQRITQPGKLTVVYVSAAEEAEYLGCFKELQQTDLLESEIEYFETKDLQDVSGLKVLRVAIKSESEHSYI